MHLRKPIRNKHPSKEKTYTCKCDEKEDGEEGLLDGECAYFMRKLKVGKGKFKGKILLICFSCGEVGKLTKKCLNISDGNSKGKKVFKKFNKKGEKKLLKRSFLFK